MRISDREQSTPPRGHAGDVRPAWRIRQSLALLLVPLVALFTVTTLVGAGGSMMQKGFGAFGPEGPRLREQLWIVPGADGPLRATVFRPRDDGPHPLVVINHGTSEDTRLAVSMPVYYWLSRWFVDRGYVVVLPQRRGHGATGGPLAEAVGDCAEPDHFASGNVAADDIAATLAFLQQQPFVAKSGAIVVGVSSGGWASLALAARNPPGVAAIVNFAGGRGGHAYGVANAICGEENLVDSAARFGETARTPTIWFYAENDSYFSPELARKLASAWTTTGGRADLNLLPPYGDEGHIFPEDRAGWTLWGDRLDAFLKKEQQPATNGDAIASAPSQPEGFLNRVLWAR